MSDQTTLLLGKTKEYDGLPAHILGLDRWVLMSLDKSKRKYFLEKYRTLMKTVHHPDLTQDADNAAARVQFLQALDEAANFLATDEQGFELAMDTLPIKQNFVVKMKLEIDRLQTIIKTYGEEESQRLLETQRILADVLRLKQELGKVHEDFQAYKRNNTENPKAKIALSEHSRNFATQGFPVGLLRGNIDLSGGWLDMSAWPRRPDRLAQLIMDYDRKNPQGEAFARALVATPKLYKPDSLTLRDNLVPHYYLKTIPGKMKKGKIIKPRCRTANGWEKAVREPATREEDRVIEKTLRLRTCGSLTFVGLCEFVLARFAYASKTGDAGAKLTSDMVVGLLRSLTAQDCITWPLFRAHLPPTVAPGSILVFHGQYAVKGSEKNVLKFYWNK